MGQPGGKKRLNQMQAGSYRTRRSVSLRTSHQPVPAGCNTRNPVFHQILTALATANTPAGILGRDRSRVRQVRRRGRTMRIRRRG